VNIVKAAAVQISPVLDHGRSDCSDEADGVLFSANRVPL
jgi:hypothetical protein